MAWVQTALESVLAITLTLVRQLPGLIPTLLSFMYQSATKNIVLPLYCYHWQLRMD